MSPGSKGQKLGGRKMVGAGQEQPDLGWPVGLRRGAPSAG